MLTIRRCSVDHGAFLGSVAVSCAFWRMTKEYVVVLGMSHENGILMRGISGLGESDISRRRWRQSLS